MTPPSPLFSPPPPQARKGGEKSEGGPKPDSVAWAFGYSEVVTIPNQAPTPLNLPASMLFLRANEGTLRGGSLPTRTGWHPKKPGCAHSACTMGRRRFWAALFFQAVPARRCIDAPFLLLPVMDAQSRVTPAVLPQSNSAPMCLHDGPAPPFTQQLFPTPAAKVI